MGTQSNRSGLNMQLIEGNLGKDIKFSTSENGTFIAVLDVCVNSIVNGQDHTAWFRVKAFNDMAKGLRQYGKKGRHIFIRGETKNKNYKKNITVELPDGTKVTGKTTVYTSEVIIAGYRWLDNKPTDSNSENMGNC